MKGTKQLKEKIVELMLNLCIAITADIGSQVIIDRMKKRLKKFLKRKKR